MELLHLRWRTAFKPDGASVGEGCGLAVDWFAHAEGTAIVPIEQADLTGGVLIAKRLARSKNRQHLMIDALVALNVVGTDHHVAEHPCTSCLRCELGVLCGLTFDMSGRQQTAKSGIDCPLDGRVRRLLHGC